MLPTAEVISTPGFAHDTRTARDGRTCFVTLKSQARIAAHKQGWQPYIYIGYIYIYIYSTVARVVVFCLKKMHYSSLIRSEKENHPSLQTSRDINRTLGNLVYVDWQWTRWVSAQSRGDTRKYLVTMRGDHICVAMQFFQVLNVLYCIIVVF